MSLVSSSAWENLQALADSGRTMHLRDLFAGDAQRFERFSVRHEGMLLDYSKHAITPEILSALHALWHAAELPTRIAAMRSGELINHTEGRAVLHTALRHSGVEAICVDGKDVMPDVRRVLSRDRKSVV